MLVKTLERISQSTRVQRDFTSSLKYLSSLITSLKGYLLHKPGLHLVTMDMVYTH